ncbi:AAA family ATPase [Bacillus sp. Marseille-P3661]|uniref:AAA family ATPase n=1 Tax=Bacillus sp. Marseille-P3661 TaxID=1936234 RepID=UPI000C8413A3|nr:AAA family ATPase [Bacillus sp. Marseille-P3661]
MIPWRLTFIGIRDYAPTLIDLSGEYEHVMITGPNGAGKSTITFCMGAVLYSSKVDLEGLKSRNLPSDQTWKSKITLLFKNGGNMKIDAPPFIEFSLVIIQEPGQPMKKEFTIATGEEIDQWDETIKYTSGDRLYNFSAYRHALQYKYKIDPDLFYLIWYQQEVNQFAIMSPEERFRIFSEMHGIDKSQRNWEESIEKLKDTEETLQYAEINVKVKKQELSVKKNELDRYNDNQKRLKEGAKQYMGALLALEILHKKGIESDQSILQQLKLDYEHTFQTKAETKSEAERKGEEKLALVKSRNHLNIQLQVIENKIIDMQKDVVHLNEEINSLEEELKTTTAKKNKLTRTEEEVKQGLSILLHQQQQTVLDLQNNEKLLQGNKEELNSTVELKIKLEHEIKANTELEMKYQEILHIYKSSHAVTERINLLENQVEKLKDMKHSLTIQLNELKAEQDILSENRVLSSRQVESLKFFKNKNIKAYPLRELIQLDADATLHDEKLYNTIKYTIFFDGKDIIPPNDLYHVPLKGVIPDRSVTKLPKLHLQIKDNLFYDVIPLAMKALWWVEQFFKDHSFKIKNETLYDEIGLRGAQEKEGYILSEKALRTRKEKVAALLKEKSADKDLLETDIDSKTKQVRELNGVIQSVKEAEAFITMEYEREQLSRKLDQAVEKEKDYKLQIAEQEREKDRLNRLQIEQQLLDRELREEEMIYQELGQMKEKFQLLTRFQNQYTDMLKQISQMKSQRGKLDDQFDKVNRDIKIIERNIGDVQDLLESQARELSAIDKQIKDTNDRIESSQLKLVQYIEELSNLKNVHEKLYSLLIEDIEIIPSDSVQQLIAIRQDGFVKFEHAIHERVDPAAPDNYAAVKAEYDRLDDDYKRTKILLEQDLERTEQLKDHLEKTVNMRVLEIQQRFKTYMAKFQFEGEISWESYEDKRKRTHFKLYIKARKEGHRGIMEDVSVKARGGKVGKGVSGGEESLSSLLFALALLQNLQTSPGFIVLDEFDSALDENRKSKVFDLYVQELQRKLIILTPKSHEDTYLNRFRKAFVVQHDPTKPKSEVIGLIKTD